MALVCVLFVFFQAPDAFFAQRSSVRKMFFRMAKDTTPKVRTWPGLVHLFMWRFDASGSVTVSTTEFGYV